MPLPEAVLEAERIADEAEAAWDAENKETEDVTSTLDELDDTTDGDQTEPESGTPETDEVDDSSILEGDGVTGTEEPGTETPAPGLDWKQKYSTLLGKYNAEVPRLTRDLDYLRGQVEAMARTTAQRDNSPAGDVNSGAASPEGGFKRHLKKDELEEYDEDILNFQSRLARGEAEAVMSPVVTQLRQRIEQLEGRVVHDEQDSLWGAIEKEHPGAKAVNDNDPLFVDFLNQVDPASGRRYKEIGEAAYAAGDVGRVASLFTVYESSTGGGGATSAPPNGNGKVLPPVKPSRSSGGAVRTTPKEKPMLRESEISTFFSDVARGKYVGRETVMKKREAIIESAVLEGRVRPG